jgi:hypothetical protein
LDFLKQSTVKEISMATASDRVIYADTSKMKLLGAMYKGIMMPNKIQS